MTVSDLNSKVFQGTLEAATAHQMSLVKMNKPRGGNVL